MKYETAIKVSFKRGGKTYNIAQRVESLEYSDSAEETNMVTLTVEDVLTDLIDHPDFIDDAHTTIVFQFGYIGDMSEPKSAILSYLKPSFPQNDAIKLEMKGHDLGLYMQKGKKTKVWQRKKGYTPSELAEAIAEENGLRAVVTKCAESTRKLRWPQGNQTDLQFLKKIAKSAVPADGRKGANYVVYIDGDELHFEMKKTSADPDFTFTYFSRGTSELLSFEPEIQENKKSDEVKVADPKKKNDIKKDSSNTPRNSLGNSDNNNGNKGKGGTKPAPAPKKNSNKPKTNKPATPVKKRDPVKVNPDTGQIIW